MEVVARCIKYLALTLHKSDDSRQLNSVDLPTFVLPKMNMLSENNVNLRNTFE